MGVYGFLLRVYGIPIQRGILSGNRSEKLPLLPSQVWAKSARHGKGRANERAVLIRRKSVHGFPDNLVRNLTMRATELFVDFVERIPHRGADRCLRRKAIGESHLILKQRKPPGGESLRVMAGAHNLVHQRSIDGDKHLRIVFDGVFFGKEEILA